MIQEEVNLNDAIAHLRKEFDLLSESKLDFVLKVKKDLARIWPFADKIKYVAKYHDRHEKSEWLKIGEQEAIKILNLEFDSDLFNAGDHGTRYSSDLVFIENAFYRIEVRINWDSRKEGSTTIAYERRPISDERVVELLNERRAISLFFRAVHKIMADFRKKLVETKKETNEFNKLLEKYEKVRVSY